MSAWWFNWIQSHLSWANCHEGYDLLWKNHLKDVDVYYWGSSVAVKVVFFWKRFFFHTIKVKSILGSRILKNTFFCLPQMKESYRDLEQMNWIIFFWMNYNIKFWSFSTQSYVEYSAQVMWAISYTLFWSFTAHYHSVSIYSKECWDIFLKNSHFVCKKESHTGLDQLEGK